MFLIREHNLNATRDMLKQLIELHQNAEISLVKCVGYVLHNVWDRFQSSAQMKHLERNLNLMKWIAESGNYLETSTLLEGPKSVGVLSTTTSKQVDEKEEEEEEQDAKTTKSESRNVSSESLIRAIDCIENDFTTVKFEVTKFMLLQFDKLISEPSETKKRGSFLGSKRSHNNAYVNINDKKIKKYVETNYGKTVWQAAEKMRDEEIKKIKKREGKKKQINRRIQTLAAVTRAYWDHEHQQTMKGSIRPEQELKRLRQQRMFHNQLCQLYYQVATKCLHENKNKDKDKENHIVKIQTDEVVRECLEQLDLISGAETVKTLREVCLQADKAMSIKSMFQQWVSELRRSRQKLDEFRVPVFEGSQMSRSIEDYLEGAESLSVLGRNRRGEDEDSLSSEDEEEERRSLRGRSSKLFSRQSSRRLSRRGSSVRSVRAHVCRSMAVCLRISISRISFVSLTHTARKSLENLNARTHTGTSAEKIFQKNVQNDEFRSRIDDAFHI